MPAMKLINSTDQNLMFLQSNIKSVIDALQAAPLTGGKILKAVKLVSGQDNLVPHNLGSPPTLYFTLLPDVQSAIWSPSSDSTNLNLHCSVSCTVNVWVT